MYIQIFFKKEFYLLLVRTFLYEMILQLQTVEKFLRFDFLWSHTPPFEHILWCILIKMHSKSGVWDLFNV